MWLKLSTSIEVGDMEIVLVELDKVIKSARIDFDYFDPNLKGITNFVKGYTKEVLSNICLRINTGKTAPRNSYPDSGVRILKVKNNTGKGINWDEKFFVKEDFYNKAESKAKIQIGDILMLCSAHNKIYIGRCDLVDTFPVEILEDDSRCCCVGELIMIRANPEKVMPEYLVTYLRLPVVKNQIRRMVKGQSAHLYPTDLSRLEIILPPKKIQEELAELNTSSQNEYNYRITEATELLQKARDKIEHTILNGNEPR
ncbi:hypothetical protein ES703_117538 [subsurface metagenome]